MDSTKRHLALFLQQGSRFCFSGIFCELQQTGISPGGRIQSWSSPVHPIQVINIPVLSSTPSRTLFLPNSAKPEHSKASESKSGIFSATATLPQATTHKR